MGETTQVWGEMLDVLKDISSYLAKADSEQKSESLEDTPTAGEKQDEISGGETSGKPGADVTKAVVAEDEDSKEDEKEDEKEDADEGEELKSLLKDIASALGAIQKSSNPENISKMVSDQVQKSLGAELKKSLPATIKVETERMLRKMGFQPTRSDVVRIGAEQPELDIKKSADVAITVADGDAQIKEANAIVDNQSKKSWEQLAVEREKLGHFSLFNR